MRNSVVLGLLIALSGLLSQVALAGGFGDCTDAVESRWLPDGRTMELLADFQYIDSRKKTWIAKAGDKVDGASIPPPLWSFIGSPFVGLHRNASVTHDVECESERETWQNVHSMFFEAMRCAGVGEVKARIMYAAVYHCGPRWGEDQGLRALPCEEEALKEYIRRFKRFFNDNKLIPIAAIGGVGRGVLDEIDGASPFERLRERGFNVIGTEDLDGFTVIIPNFDFDGEEGRTKNQEILALLTEEASRDSIVVEGLPDRGEYDLHERLAASHRASKAERILLELGLDEDQVKQMSYGEEHPGAIDYPGLPSSVSRAVAIRVIQVQDQQ